MSNWKHYYNRLYPISMLRMLWAPKMQPRVTASDWSEASLVSQLCKLLEHYKVARHALDPVQPCWSLPWSKLTFSLVVAACNSRRDCSKRSRSTLATCPTALQAASCWLGSVLAPLERSARHTAHPVSWHHLRGNRSHLVSLPLQRLYTSAL